MPLHKDILLPMYFQERERQKEEKRLEAIRLREWNKPREDLELDDLKVKCEICPKNYALVLKYMEVCSSGERFSNKLRECDMW